MFWVDQGPGERLTLERAALDGSSRISLAVLTGQAPRGLALDVAARRLYWISDFKKASVASTAPDKYINNNNLQKRPIFKNILEWCCVQVVVITAA